MLLPGVLLAAGLALGLVPATGTTADDDAAQQLAERYAPVVRLQADSTDCEQGEHFQPTDVEAVLGDVQVALRGPWTQADLVQIAPEARDIEEGLPGYFLDFPGNALRPGCTYAEWSALINQQFPMTVYAHVTTDPGYPGQLALQYWFFYVFNDYNNTHEGDWESVQLIFDAATPQEALGGDPIAVGYSQHGGAERALWGDEKLEIVDGTHPVVYPAAGSHANHYGAKLYLGRGEAGLGCDDTTDPLPGAQPEVAFIPMASPDYLRAYPWLGFEGRWGERQESFFNGPTGPSQKGSWTRPIRDAERNWRDDSPTVPAGSLLGPSATGAFCTTVATGSNLFRQSLDNPMILVIVLAVVAGLIWLAASRTRWTPNDPIPARARRAWGQCVTAALRLFLRHPVLMVAFGLSLLPLSVGVAALAAVGTSKVNSGALDESTDQSPASWAGALALVLSLLAILVYATMTTAVAWTLTQLDDSRPVSFRAAIRHLRPRVPSLLAVTARYYLTILVLTLLLATIPLALYYGVSRAYALPAFATEARSSSAALRRSRDVVRGRWWRNAMALAIIVGLGLTIAPLIGMLLLLVSDLDAGLINIMSSVAYAVTLPIVAVAVTYLYFDGALREDAEQRSAEEPGRPASELSTSR